MSEKKKKRVFTKDQIENYKKYLLMDPVSLQTPVGDEEDSELIDFVESTGFTSDDIISQKILKESLHDILQEALQEKEIKVLTLRYGLDNTEPKTLEEVGAIFHVTRERIRQIQKKALDKLSKPKYAKQLQDFLKVI